MPASVIDTNVLSVAERRHPGASPECELECARLLDAVVQGDVAAVLDDENRILGEYRANVALKSGQLGVGGRFLIWLLNNRWTPEACEQVAIHVLSGSVDGCDFAEFPNDPALQTFDRNDRKFVAVAIASSLSPGIENATDPGWWTHRVALANNGVRVEFLCPELMED
jgi:hypothetical protein